jgi:glycosyltransferase involved in cell wall biosynthesis
MVNMRPVKVRKILNLATDAFSREGGIAVFERSLLYALGNISSPKFEVTSFNLMDIEEDVSRAIINNGIPREVCIRAFNGNRARFSLAVLCFILSKSPDLVICGHVNLAPLAWLGRCLGGSQYCVWLYYYEIRGAHGIWRKRALLGANFSIAISDFTRSVVQREFPGIKNVRTCLLGLPFDTFLPPGEIQTPREFQGRRVLLIVARMPKGISKGHRLLFSALRIVRIKVPNVLLCVVGRGDDETSLREYAMKCGVTDLVHWAGFVPDEDLPGYIMNSEIFVMPSDAEGFGLVYLIAMAYKKPCIGGANGAGPEIIEHGKTGFLVQRDDVSELANKITELLCNDTLRLAFGEAGYSRFNSMFTYNVFSQRLFEILGLKET